MPKLDFVPKRDGFHFPNAFQNYVLPGVLNLTTYGRCGGMALASLDYYRAGAAVPTHVPADFAPGSVPVDGTRLSTYIYDRLMDSLMNLSAAKFVTGPWITDANCYYWSTHDEFAAIRSAIDSGRMRVLGLWGIASGNPGEGHQVVCYGYETSPMCVYVYDNNYPDEEIRLVPVSPIEGIQLRGENGQFKLEANGSPVHYRGYFVHDVYDWSAPPVAPRYFDLGIASGLTLNPAGPDYVAGDPLECDVTIRNYGDYPAHLKWILIYARDPAGQNIDRLFGPPEIPGTPLQPGEQRRVTRRCDSFGNQPGNYVVGVCYLSCQDQWCSLYVAEPGAVRQRQIAMHNPLRLIQDTWFDVREADWDVDTHIDVQPGDEYSLEALGSIWGGVWFTGQNGPTGWANVSTDPKFPLHSGPDAHPYGLLGRFQDSGYFFIGNGQPRHPYGESSAKRLYLRINDDRPGNGSGAFRCRAQVWRA